MNVSCSPQVPRSSCDERLNPSIAPTSSNTITGRARNDRTLNAMLPSDEMMLPNRPSRSLDHVQHDRHDGGQHRPLEQAARPRARPGERGAERGVGAVHPLSGARHHRRLPDGRHPRGQQGGDGEDDPCGPAHGVVVAPEQRDAGEGDDPEDHERGDAGDDRDRHELTVLRQHLPGRLRQPPPVPDAFHAESLVGGGWRVEHPLRSTAGGIARGCLRSAPVGKHSCDQSPQRHDRYRTGE